MREIMHLREIHSASEINYTYETHHVSSSINQHTVNIIPLVLN